MSVTKEDLVKAVETMSVLELNELIETLKEKFNVTGTPMMAVAGGGDDGGGGEAEKSSFNVVLKEVGTNKINVIKEVKAILGVGLKEAKDFVDKPGQALKEGANKEAAEEMKTKLEAAGAVVELQ